MAYRNYSTANGLLVDPAGNGDYTTITAALNAAVSGQTVFVRDGTYTENPTGKAGVVLSAFFGDSSEPTVILNGTLSYSSLGTFIVTNIQLQTNGAPALSVGGTSASLVTLNNCFVNANNNVGINFTSTSGSSQVVLNACTLSGIHFYNHSSAGTLYFEECYGSQSTIVQNTVSGSGSVVYFYCDMAHFVTMSGTGNYQAYWSALGNASNSTCLTQNSSGANCIALGTTYSSGTASAISIGSGSSFYMYGSCSVTSSNANAITGSGTLLYTPIDFFGSSSTVNVTTQTLLPSGPKMYAPGGITFDNTNVMANYVASGTWTPTLQGGSTGGSTTYSIQQGYYTRVGNLVAIQGVLTGTAATGTGNAIIGALPFTIRNQTNGTVVGTCTSQSAAGWTWPASTTQLSLTGTLNSTNAPIYASGSGTTGGNLQMANASFAFYFQMNYEI